MNTLILHVGTQKTGSSALQVFLARNREALLAHSIDYLPTGEFGLGLANRISSGNGAFLSRCLLPEGAPGKIIDLEPHLGACLSAIRQSPAATGIISSELFLDADPEALFSLLAQLRRMNLVVKCFYYIRPQVQFLCSAYMQQVKRHGCTDLPDSYVRRVYGRIPFLRYSDLFRHAAELFGYENILCRTYDRAIAAKHGLFCTFLQALSLDPAGFDFSVHDVNTSMSPREIAIMLAINRFRPRMQFSDFVVENAAYLGTGHGQVHNLLSSGLVDEVNDYFRDQNKEMALQYFRRPELFLPVDMPRDPDPVSLDDLSAGELVSFFCGLLVRFDERLANLENRITGLESALARQGETANSELAPASNTDTKAAEILVDPN